MHVVVDFLFIVTSIVGVCNCSMFCCTLLYVHSSIAIILMGKRELIALLNLSSWCLVMVERLFLAVPWGCLQFVIVVFPDHTHLLFLSRKPKSTLVTSILTVVASLLKPLDQSQPNLKSDLLILLKHASAFLFAPPTPLEALGEG